MSNFANISEACAVGIDDNNDSTSGDNEGEKEQHEVGEKAEPASCNNAISTDIAFVKANIVKAAVLTVSRDYITVVIM